MKLLCPSMAPGEHASVAYFACNCLSHFTENTVVVSHIHKNHREIADGWRKKKRRTGNWRIKEKGRKWKSRISKDGREKVYNTRYLLLSCSSHCCSSEGVLCICREVIVPLSPYKIFSLILKLRSCPRLLRKVVEIERDWRIFLTSISAKKKRYCYYRL